MKPKFVFCVRRGLPLLALALPLLSQPLQAASITWSNTGTDFNAGAGWVGGTAPGDTDIATFTGAKVTNPALSAAASVKGLAFSNAAASGYTISGNTLTVGSSGIDASAVTSGTNTISSALVLSAGQFWSVGSGSTLAVNPSTFTRSVGATLNVENSGGLTTSTLTNTNGILGTWSAVNVSGSYGYAVVSGGNIQKYTAPNVGSTSDAVAWGGMPSTGAGGDGVSNWDITVAGSGAGGLFSGTGLGRSVNTIRYTGATAARQNSNSTAIGGVSVMTLNGFMNAGVGAFTVGGDPGTAAPAAANGRLNITIGASKELVIAPITANIVLNGAILNNAGGASGLTLFGNNSAILAGASTYTGATTISKGTLQVSGTFGAINSTSGITINGTGAKYLHTSSVASTRPISLNLGTLDGTGSLGAVTVADNPSAILTHGNGATPALTLSSLSFGGRASVNLNNTAGVGVVVTGALSTTPAKGQVALNVSNGVPNGLVNLVSFGTFSGNPSDFTVNLAALGARQVASAPQLNGSNIAVNISAESIVWSGTTDNVWQTATSGDSTGPNNWARKTAQTATNFWVADAVEFNDTYNLGSGNVAVTQTQVAINAAVSPASTTFNNSAVNYEISGASIAGGSLVKTGTGTVTLLNANTYTGATTVNQGKLQLGNGTTNGSLATASVTNNATLEYNLGAAQTAGYAITGSGSVVKNGFGTLTLTGASTYSGGTVINEGLVVATSNGLNGGAITVNSPATLTFTGNGQTSTSTLSGSGSIVNNTANTIVLTGDHTGFSGNFVHNAAANNTQFNSANSASQNASYSLTNGELIFAANGDYTVKFGSLGSSAGNIRGGNAATGTTTVEVGNLGYDSILAGNFANGATKILSLRKVGSGTLTISGGASYTGATTVNGGTLAFTTAPKTLGTSAVSVADSAGLSVKAAAAGTTMLPTGSLTLGASTLNFDFSTLSPTATQISTGALTLNGALTINLFNSLALGTGTYKLIDYTTLSGSGTLPTGSFSLGNRATATIVNNTVDTSIDLNVVNDTPKWTGLDSGQWLAGSTGANSNWKLGVSGTATDYLDDDQVLFDDSATGTRAIVIDSSNVFPANTTFNTSTSTYTLSGASGIAGGGSLTKSGTGSVTITNTNTYIGATTINAGTLQLGDGTMDGSIASTSAVTDNGTLAYNLVADRTAAYVISGTGTVTKTGVGSLTLTGANTYSGGTTLNSGVLNLAVNGTLGTGSIALGTGTTLNINKNLALTNVVTGSGAIVNTASLTNTGDFTGFSGSLTHNSTVVSAAFNSATTTSQNAAYIIASDQGSSQGLIAGGNGDYTLKLGSLSGVANSLFRGGNTATGTTILEIGNLGTSTEFAGLITNGATKTIGLTKVGAGTLTLSGACNYTASTLVNVGTLSVTGSLAAGSSVTVGSGAILKGSGTVAGAIGGAGTIAPGVGAGTLTTGAVTQIGNLAIEIDGATGDKLLSTGAIDLTGTTLTVSLLPGGFSQASYVIAEGTSITGTFSTVPSGYTVSIVSGGAGQQAVLTSNGGYGSWASTHVGGDAANVDTDKDGVANGVEYFMNSADGFTANPGIVSGAVTWPNGGNIPSSAYGTQFKVQTSTNLTDWAPVDKDDSHLSNTSGSVTYTLPTGSGTLFVRLKVSPN